MDITRVAAIIYAILMVGVVAFQIALAAGAPWGAYAMGGASPGQFSPAMRVSAIVQAVLLAGMAVVILARAGLILPGWWRVSHWLVWIVVAITALSLVLNLITPSAGERAIWLPTLSLLLISSFFVAFSKWKQEINTALRLRGRAESSVNPAILRPKKRKDELVTFG